MGPIKKKKKKKKSQKKGQWSHNNNNNNNNNNNGQKNALVKYFCNDFIYIYFLHIESYFVRGRDQFFSKKKRKRKKKSPSTDLD